MGKYSIGARVRDPDGDIGEIVGKPAKGVREIRYEGGKLDGVVADWLKRELEVLERAGPGGAADAWQPKVGERVIVTNTDFGNEYSFLQNGSVGVIRKVEPHYNGVEFDDDADELDWAFYNNQIAPFTLEAGKFYRTRDGRKVGPMIPVKGGHYDPEYTFASALPLSASTIWCTDGSFYSGGSEDESDIVAEWVEPAVPEALSLESGRRYCGESGATYVVESNPDNPSWPFKTAGEPLAKSRFWLADGTPYNESGWNDGAETGDRIVSLSPPYVPFVGDKVTVTGIVVDGANDNCVTVVFGGNPSNVVVPLAALSPAA